MVTEAQARQMIFGPFRQYIDRNTNIITAETEAIPGSVDYRVLVGVRSLRTERALRALGAANFAVPLTLPLSRDTSVSFAIFEVGDVRAFANVDCTGPCPPGFSIGHPRVTAGTFGCLVQHSDNPQFRYILSNNHVLAASNRGRVGDPILQPGREDGGTIANTIARLEVFEPLNYVSSNQVDAALGLVGNDSTSAVEWDFLVKSELPGIGTINGFADPAAGMSVCKVGRTTNVTYGKILNPNVPIVEPNYGPGLGVLTFVDQIKTTPMASDGDSGSVLVEESSGNVVGLLFAGSDEVTYFNPIRKVLQTLAVRLGGGSFSPG